jgi:hypothetical protein
LACLAILKHPLYWLAQDGHEAFKVATREKVAALKDRCKIILPFTKSLLAPLAP